MQSNVGRDNTYASITSKSSFSFTSRLHFTAQTSGNVLKASILSPSAIHRNRPFRCICDALHHCQLPTSLASSYPLKVCTRDRLQSHSIEVVAAVVAVRVLEIAGSASTIVTAASGPLVLSFAWSSTALPCAPILDSTSIIEVHTRH